MKRLAAVIAAIALFLGGFAGACGGKNDEPCTFAVSQTHPGTGGGGISGTGLDCTQP